MTVRSCAPYITGYTDLISGAVGDNIRFYIGCSEPMNYSVELVRIICGDTNPAGPGLKLRRIPSSLEGTYKGEFQPIFPGSFAIVPRAPSVCGLATFTVGAWIMPTTVRKGRQIIVSQSDGPNTFEMGIGDDGALSARLTVNGEEICVASSGKALLDSEWYHVSASCQASVGAVILRQKPRNPMLGLETVAERSFAPWPSNGAPEEAITAFGARLRSSTEGRPAGDFLFNGRIESPVLVSGYTSKRDISSSEVIHSHDPGPFEILAAWDFSIGIETDRIVDVKGDAHGTLINLPTRGVTGHLWTGREHCWKAVPEQYAALHFHDDDLYDAGWADSFSWVIEDVESGLYAAHVRSETAEDYIPFYVRPHQQGRKREVVFLAPTASYMAYANDHSPTNAHLAELELGQATNLSATDIFLNEHREFGASLYDTHSDGSGVAYSSRLRPILTMRPQLTSWLGGSGSSLWQFNADTHILDWLDRRGVAADVITDEDLDGIAGILDGHRVLITGTHPEYFSPRMRNAVAEFIARGGRLMYLGGNGWYWKIAFHKTLPGVIEVRRAEGGVRAWEAAPGEYYQSFDGEHGGLWRRQGLAPQEALGVGFSAQGFDVSSFYRRTEQSCDARVGFIFDGIPLDERIGDFGLTGGGAAGLELDRADRSLGTPRHALVVATSCDHTDTYVVVPEEILINTATYTGTQSELVRSDLVFFETPFGGAVFSVGSIAWAGSLSHNQYENNVDRLTGNVLSRFADATPFKIPEV